MKKQLISWIVAVLMVLAIPVAANARENPWSYDNSFLAIVEWPHDQPLELLFPEGEFCNATVVCKLPGEQTDTYRVVYTATDSYEADVWEACRQSMLQWEWVEITEVCRNSYAWDYAEKDSYVTPSQTEIRLAVGETTQVQVVDWRLAGGDSGEMIGIEFVVDAKAFPTIEKGSFAAWGIVDFWAVPADATKSDSLWHPIYQGYGVEWEGGWFDRSYLNAPSETNTYFGVITEDGWQSGMCLYQAKDLLDRMGTSQQFFSVQPIYRHSYPTGARPYELWETQGDAAVITAMEVIDHPEEDPSPAAHTECFWHEHLVTLKGVKEGTSVLRVTKSNGTSHTVEIPVTVYPAGRYVPGDADGNTRVDAADALLILKAAVGKYFFDNNPQGERVADLDGNGTLDAVDALGVLRIAVGKQAF